MNELSKKLILLPAPRRFWLGSGSFDVAGSGWIFIPGKAPLNHLAGKVVQSAFEEVTHGRWRFVDASDSPVNISMQIDPGLRIQQYQLYITPNGIRMTGRDAN